MVTAPNVPTSNCQTLGMERDCACSLVELVFSVVALIRCFQNFYQTHLFRNSNLFYHSYGICTNKTLILLLLGLCLILACEHPQVVKLANILLWYLVRVHFNIDT